MVPASARSCSDAARIHLTRYVSTALTENLLWSVESEETADAAGALKLYAEVVCQGRLSRARAWTRRYNSVGKSSQSG